MPITQTEFAAKIRQKYPQYQDIDDSTLVAKIVEEYPVYRNQISDFGQPTIEPTPILEPQPLETPDPIRELLSPETAELYDKIKKQQVDVGGGENIIQRSLGVLKEKFKISPEQEAKFGELVQGFGMPESVRKMTETVKREGFFDIYTDQLRKELEDKPLASEFITGLFGERADIGQKIPEAKTIPEKVARGAAGLAGIVVSFAPISKAVKYVGVGAKIAVKHRLIGRLIGSIETFVAHGQVMTTSKDYNERLKLAGQDLATGLAFGLVGGLGKDYLKGITGEVASYPAMFGIGFGMSKMGDSSNEDAIINGALLVALHGLFDIGGKKKAKTFLVDKLKEQGIDKPESVVEEAFKQAEEFKRTNQKDYEELFGISKPFKPIKPIKPFEPADIEEVSKLRAEEALKKAEAERKLTVPEPEIVEKERIKTIPIESKITPEKPEVVEKPKEVKIEKPKEEVPKPIIPAIAVKPVIKELEVEKPTEVTKTENLGLEVVEVDLIPQEVKGEEKPIPVVAHLEFDWKTGTSVMQINPKEWAKTPEGWGTIIKPGKKAFMAHEEGHHIWMKLKVEQKAELRKLWDADEIVQKSIRALHPTATTMGEREWIPFEFAGIKKATAEGKKYPLENKKLLELIKPYLTEADIATITPEIAEKPKAAPTIPKVDDIATTGKLDSEKVIPEPTVRKPKPEPEPTIKEDKKFFTDISKDIEAQVNKVLETKVVAEGKDIKAGENFTVTDNKIKIKSPQGEYEFTVPRSKAELKELKSSINEAFKQDEGFVKVTSGIRKRTPVMESLRVLEDKTAPPARVKTAKALLEIEGIGFKKGVKEAKNKAEHQDHKHNPYTPGTLEWNKWNEAWENYDSLEQEPPKLYGGLPFHLLIPEKIRRRVRTFFEPFANIPEGQEAQIRRYKMIGKLDKADDFIKMVHKELDTFDGEVKKDMFRYLDGQLSLSDLPVEARPIAKKTQQRLINIGKMLVKRDIISKETFEGLKGKYVPYMYARHIIGEGATTRLSPGGGLDLSYTIARNPDLTVTQKRALGQIEDASVVVPAGMGKSLGDIAKFDYYADIAKNPNWVWKPSLIEVDGKRVGIGKLVEDVKTYSKMAKEFPESPEIVERYNNLKEALDKSRVDTKNAPNDFKAMPVSKRYGDLSGAYIRKPIADDIIPLIGTKFGERGDLFGTLAKVEQQGVALHKMGKVALNPPTVFRNVISNFLQNNMRGRPIAYIPGDLVKAGKSILSEDKYFKESKKYGLFRTNWSVTEIRDVINEFAGVDPGKWGTFYKAVSNISKYYGKIDDVAKHTIFVQLRSDGVPVEKAILEAHKWGMDYSLGSRSIKELRRHVMPFTCVDDKTEILTKRGWLNYNEVKIGDFALSLNMNTEETSWQPIVDIYKADYQGNKMLHFKDRHLDMMLTPDHKVVTYHGRQKDTKRYLNLELTLASKINSQDHIPVAAKCIDFPKNKKYSDEFVQIIGWIVTEGHFHSKCDAIFISQNKGANFDKIISLLDSEFGKVYRIDENRKDQFQVYIKAKIGKAIKEIIPNKHLTPEFVLELTQRQLHILANTMIAGDGSRRKNGDWCFIQKPGQTFDSFQLISCLLGVSYGYGKRETVHTVQNRKITRYCTKRITPKEIIYNRKIWCPLVPTTSTWYARRNGKVFITHNTYQYKIAPLIIESLSKRPWVIGKYLAIPFIMKEAAQQLEDISDDDWKELKAKLPDYVKDNKTYMVIPWKNEEGNWQFVNLEYYFPWGNQLAITKDISKGQWDEAAKNSGIGNPFFDLYRGLVTNKDPFTRKQIINPVDSPAKQWLSATGFLSSRFIGSAFTSYGALGQTIKIGEEDGWGNEIRPGKAIGKWFGWNVITVHPKMTVAMKKKKVRELQSNFLKIKNDPNNSAAYIENARKRFIIMRREIMTGEPAK